MRLVKTIACFSLFMALPVAACEIEDVTAEIIENSSSSSFVQTKNIEVLSRPLRSTGMLRKSDDGSLIWQIQRPIKSTLTINANGIEQFNREDELIQRLTDSISTGVSNIFLALLSGEIDSLDQSFSSQLDCSDSGWTLTLTPINEVYEQLFAFISIAKVDTGISIKYEEARGDSTEIVFTPIESTETEFLERYLEY